MKQVYIASPLRGDYDTNIRNAVEYCRLVAEHGISTFYDPISLDGNSLLSENGCVPGFYFSDSIHLLHPADRDRLAVGRSEVWGIAKPETLEWLTALQPVAEPDEEMSR